MEFLEEHIAEEFGAGPAGMFCKGQKGVIDFILGRLEALHGDKNGGWEAAGPSDNLKTLYRLAERRKRRKIQPMITRRGFLGLIPGVA